jgi:hypothetical protein
MCANKHKFNCPIAIVSFQELRKHTSLTNASKHIRKQQLEKKHNGETAAIQKWSATAGDLPNQMSGDTTYEAVEGVLGRRE